MFKRFNIIMLVAVLGVLLSVVFASAAQAEQCSPDGKICLVTDTSQPVQTPGGTLLFKVTNKATYFTGYMVQQGPGDTNLWEVTLDEVESDGVLAVSVYAGIPPTCDGCSGYEYVDATFQVPVLAPVVNTQIRIIRQGRRFLARATYDARIPLLAHLRFYNSVAKDATSRDGPSRSKRVMRPAGPQVIQAVISRSSLERYCRRQHFCTLYTDIVHYYQKPRANGGVWNDKINYSPSSFCDGYACSVMRTVKRYTANIKPTKVRKR